RHWIGGVLELDDEAGSVEGDEPGRDTCLDELVIDLPDGGIAARAAVFDALDLRPEVEQALLELVLLALEAERGLHERRAFLAPRRGAPGLRRGVGGDEGAVAEE